MPPEVEMFWNGMNGDDDDGNDGFDDHDDDKIEKRRFWNVPEFHWFDFEDLEMDFDEIERERVIEEGEEGWGWLFGGEEGEKDGEEVVLEDGVVFCGGSINWGWY